MRSQSATRWEERAAGLARDLTERGVLRSAVWRAAVTQTPRHVFVPPSTSPSTTGVATEGCEIQGWLAEVYADTTLVTQRRQAPQTHSSGALATSSSTRPSLMIEMLEALDVQDGHHVLEIGTGTGYNAALLAHRLGADHVVSIDLDPDLVAAAADRLRELGHRPTLIAGDGRAGVADHGPYDRIIATCAVPEIPLAWIDQLTPGGTMLINLRGHLAGVLCLLTKHDADEVIGSALRTGADFMWLRHQLDNPLRTPESPVLIGARHVTRSRTHLSPATLAHKDFRWMLQLGLPGLRLISPTDVIDPKEQHHRPCLLLYAQDGSHAQVITEPDDDGHYRVIQGGPHRIWDTVETTHHHWTHLGTPAPHRFGVVANHTTQFVWLDHDTDWWRWPLPLT